MWLCIITYNSRPSAGARSSRGSSPVSVAPLTHSSKSPVLSVITGTKYATAACPHIPRGEAACCFRMPHLPEPCQPRRGGDGEGTEVVTCGARPLRGPGVPPPKGGGPNAVWVVEAVVHFRRSIPSVLPAEASITRWVDAHTRERSSTYNTYTYTHTRTRTAEAAAPAVGQRPRKRRRSWRQRRGERHRGRGGGGGIGGGGDSGGGGGGGGGAATAVAVSPVATVCCRRRRRCCCCCGGGCCRCCYCRCCCCFMMLHVGIDHPVRAARSCTKSEAAKAHQEAQGIAIRAG